MTLAALLSGKSSGCGSACIARYAELAGRRFGAWTVLARLARRGGGAFLVRCDCGTEEERGFYELRTGRSSQCTRCAHKMQGGTARTHGLSKAPIYASWRGMNRRCYAPTERYYEQYGGRGITVCDRWRAEWFGGEPGAIRRFLTDMGERPAGKTLDRIDNDGNYEPGNCRWATPKEQRANRRVKTHCKRGHPREFGEPCQECSRIRALESYHRRRQAERP